MDRSVESIYEELKSNIINLDLVPGTKIREEDLASRFNVSRTPIRTVIARLEKDDLLTVVPQKGTYVSKINIANISDFIYVRKAVEVSVLQIVEKTLTLQQIQQLNDILAQQHEIIMMETSIEKSKMFFHNDNLFHATLFRFANLEGVWKLIHTEATTLNRVRIMANLRTTTQVEKIYAQHKQIVECLKNHQIDDAIQIFASHMDGGFEGINEVIEKYKDYFM
jgi:DNA-binding GntR family transcriptional regulator